MSTDAVHSNRKPSASGVLDAETRPPHPDFLDLHLHRRREVCGDTSRALGRLGSSDRIRPAEGCWDLRVPGEHRAKDPLGYYAQRSR